jgi:hypothetical protein
MAMTVADTSAIAINGQSRRSENALRPADEPSLFDDMVEADRHGQTGTVARSGRSYPRGSHSKEHFHRHLRLAEGMFTPARGRRRSH